jgi:hypothetical protein
MTNPTQAQHPCDLDAERAVLASILVDGQISNPSFKLCSEARLDARAFYEPKHQTIFTALADLVTAGQVPDEITLSNHLRSSHQLETAGGLAYINELTSSLFAPSPNLSHHTRIIQEKHQARQLIYIARDLSAKALSGAFTPSELAQSFHTQAKTIIDSSKREETTQRMALADLQAFDRNNDPNCLVGRRWLCKGGSLLFSGQAGAGKSSLLTQLCISWALGKDLWGMKPVRPMRIVILQSENDLGDLAEQWNDVSSAMWLTQAETATLDENVAIYREAVKTGEAFGQLIEELVTRHNADFLMCDPLLGFSGGDISKQEFCSHFLRQILQPVLMRTGCCLIAAHHQNKPPKKKEDNVQSTYDFTGSSELANWFRSTAIIRREHQEHPHFILKLGKRGNRAGMRDEKGNFTESLRIRHSKVRGQIKWEINDQPPLEEDDV